MEIYLPKMI
jgi:hypothetical protein